MKWGDKYKYPNRLIIDKRVTNWNMKKFVLPYMVLTGIFGFKIRNGSHRDGKKRSSL